MNIRIDKDLHIDFWREALNSRNFAAQWRWPGLAAPRQVAAFQGFGHGPTADEAIEDLLVKTEEAMGIDIIVEDDSVVAALERLASQGHGAPDLC